MADIVISEKRRLRKLRVLLKRPLCHGGMRRDDRGSAARVFPYCSFRWAITIVMASGRLWAACPFTMGDFAFAVAANVGNPPTVSTN